VDKATWRRSIWLEVLLDKQRSIGATQQFVGMTPLAGQAPWLDKQSCASEAAMFQVSVSTLECNPNSWSLIPAAWNVIPIWNVVWICP
jgi:hypothetical protein